MSDNVVGIIGATVSLGQYIVNDYVITIAEAQGDYGYTMTITKGTDTQTVTLYGLTPEQYDSMVGYLEQAQAASAAAQTAQDGAEDARDAAQAALNQAITYASNAATSASAAAQSAQDASDYDYQAAQARYAAVAAKEAAVAAQGAAEAAQTAAETAASNAGTSATNAATSATSAASSETNAAGSASAAAQSATNAATSASAAAQTLTSVQAEGAAQIAAIDAEGQEVLESIPADYTELSGDVADLKRAMGDMEDVAEFVGDTNTDLGTHTEQIAVQYVNLTNRDATLDGVKYVVTNDTITVSQAATATRVLTLQDNISAVAGTYTFGINTPITSSGFSLQIWDIAGSSTIKTFSSNDTETAKTFTLESNKSIRIRSVITNGAVLSDTITLSLTRTAEGTIDNTLAYVADKTIDIIGDIETDMGQHTERQVTDLTNFTAGTVTDDGVTFVTTKTHFSATGQSGSLKVHVLQDNIAVTAGKYRFYIDSPVVSDGFALQLFSVNANNSLLYYNSTNGYVDNTITVTQSDTLKIRTVTNNGAIVNDAHEVHLQRIDTITCDDTLIYLSKRGSDLVDKIEAITGNPIKVPNGNKFAVCTFIDDDTINVDNVTNYINACDTAGIKGTLATLTIKWQNNTALRDLLKSAERAGHNVILHAYSQDINDHWSSANFDIDDCTDDLVHGMQMMQEAGFTNYRYWATPDNSDNVKLRALARQVGMKCRFIGNNWANDGTHPIDRYRIYRCGLSVDDTGSLTLAQLKAIADDCYDKGGWLVIMTHFYNENQSGDYATRLNELAQYVKTLGYQVMNVSEAWSYRRYLYDINDMFGS